MIDQWLLVGIIVLASFDAGQIVQEWAVQRRIQKIKDEILSNCTLYFVIQREREKKEWQKQMLN